MKLIDAENSDKCFGEVLCAKMNKKIVKLEKIIGRGWYEYVKENRLRRGDKLGFLYIILTNAFLFQF